MELLLTFDDNYTQHAGVTICSFLANNPGAHTIHIISDRISESNQALVNNICAASGSTVNFYFVNEADTRDFPVGPGTINPTLTIATYFRLFMADLLPKTIRKILYIDCDIIIDGPLDGLWNTTFQDGKCIAALEELEPISSDGCRRMSIPQSSSYFNAGVLLIHLERLREFFSVAKASEFIRKNHTLIRYHDQDVLNALLYDKKQFFDLQYNVMDTCLIRRATLPARYEQQRDALQSPKVIHYTGYFKPWNRESRNPYTYKYYEYLAQTPWKGYQPQSKFTDQKTKWVFYMKHLVKLCLDTIHVRNYRYISLLMLCLFCMNLSRLSATEENEMPIIAYMGVPYDKTTDENFKTLSECGFNVSLYVYGSLEQMINACHLADKYGVKILGHCTDTHEHPEKSAAVLKNVPGFFGYVLQDEPTADEINRLQEEMSRLKKVDDSHCFYINLHPYYNDGTLRHLKTRTYEDYLDIASATSCRQLSFDYYPITHDGLRDGWYHNLEMVRRQSLKTGKPFWGFVLSVPHYVYPQPTMATLLLQAYSNLAYGAQAIQYFTYWTPEPDGVYDYHNGPIGQDGKKTSTYFLVQKVNQELKTVSRLFYGCKVFSVCHLGKVSTGATKQTTIPQNISSLKVKGRRGAVVSTFEQSGHRYLCLVNKDYNHDMKLYIKVKNDTPRRITKALHEEPVKSTYTIGAGDIIIFRLT